MKKSIVPGTPQENGVLERMNRTIMENSRCMRLHARLPLKFWVDVVDTIVYLINRGPSSSLDGGIPKEAWIGKKVNYSFLFVKPFVTLILNFRSRKMSRSIHFRLLMFQIYTKTHL